MDPETSYSPAVCANLGRLLNVYELYLLCTTLWNCEAEPDWQSLSNIPVSATGAQNRRHHNWQIVSFRLLLERMLTIFIFA